MTVDRVRALAVKIGIAMPLTKLQAWIGEQVRGAGARRAVHELNNRGGVTNSRLAEHALRDALRTWGHDGAQDPRR